MLSERELTTYFNSRPPAITMPYDNPRYILNSVPDQLPFSFEISSQGDLLGTVEDGGHASGTILLQINQNSSKILQYVTFLLAGAAFSNTRESHSYQVFFPPDENGATFCREQDVAIILEIFNLENELKDVRLHYTSDSDVIERTTCGQPILAIEDFPFPHLAAPPNSLDLGGGGGGGGGGNDVRKGPMGYIASINISTDDSLESIFTHYADLLAAEEWKLLNQSSTGNSIESNWDFGFYETRSWLGRLVASVGDAPNHYIIELYAISP